jgi:deoxyribodipyrimidine photo-lyase
MVGNLLDGDLASNHLSWQWVAATFSSKPYVFNAENVAKYAPHQYASQGTVIDTSYEALDRIARSQPDVGCEPGVHGAIAAPALLPLPEGITSAGIDAIKHAVTGRQARLVHPWLLSEPSRTGLISIGVIHAPFHAEFPWSAQRWAWVMARMQALCSLVFIGDANALNAALAQASVVTSTATLNFHYDTLLPQLAQELTPPPRLLPDPDQLHSSFTKFYETARHMAKSLDALTPLNSVGIEAPTRRRHQ